MRAIFRGRTDDRLTIIGAGSQHKRGSRGVQFHCRHTRDRPLYTNDEVIEVIRQNVECEVTPALYRLKPSSIVDPSHPIVQAGLSLGGHLRFADPLPTRPCSIFPRLKLGVGDSARSHSADESCRPRRDRGGDRALHRNVEKIL